MLILYGSQDFGPRNYFDNLFKSVDFHLKEFKDSQDLDNYFRDICNVNNDKIITLTGTSLGSNTLDKKAILISKKYKIPSISVIEHWSWYLRRFQSNKGLILPDKIILNDQKAYNESIKDGLPSEKLIVLGNPVLENLAIKSLDRKMININSLKQKFKLPLNKKIILFISESLTEFRSKKDVLGFDEYIVFKFIKEFFLQYDFHILIKSHPAEPKYKYGKPDQNLSYIENIDVEELSVIPNKIIGMGSMLLLEMSFYRNDIISLRPGSKVPFIGNDLNLTIPVYDFDSINKAFNMSMKGIDKFRKSQIGSRKRILNYLKNF